MAHAVPSRASAGGVSELFASGRIIDLILGAVALETWLLLALQRRTGRGPAPVALLANNLAGVFFLLALRAALVAASWPWIAASMFAALLAHLGDLWLRLRK
jgi:hypothetical protein